MLAFVIIFASLGSMRIAEQPAAAVGSYNNANIADIALGYVGQWGGNACINAGRSGYTGGTPGGQQYDGQCRAFVNCIVWMASGKTQWLGGGAGDYFKRFYDLGAQQITDINALARGDIVQSGHGVHTYIIVSRVSGSTFNVVDSNHSLDEKVQTYNRTVVLDANNRAFRLGTLFGEFNSTIGNNSVAVSTSTNGRLEVVGVNTNQPVGQSNIYHKWQQSPGGNWSGWKLVAGYLK
ncbi:MAG: hypothetical protein AAB459_00825 [Patescibacteria group bacterium]